MKFTDRISIQEEMIMVMISHAISFQVTENNEVSRAITELKDLEGVWAEKSIVDEKIEEMEELRQFQNKIMNEFIASLQDVRKEISNGEKSATFIIDLDAFRDSQ